MTDARPLRFRMTRFGLASDPRGAQVAMQWQGRTLLGDVRGVYRNEYIGATFLRVTHFNGQPWPLDPPALSVEVLPRDYANEEDS